jgi:hypothetical protein
MFSNGSSELDSGGTYQAVKGKNLVTVILLNDRVFIQPPCPLADQGRVSRYEGGEVKEELGDVIMEKVAK